MRLQLLSDLHLETHPEWRAEAAPDADLTVLAGDIGSYQPGSGLQDSDFGLGQFTAAAGWPTPVLFIPGNHEYVGQDFDAAHARLRETCARLGLIWLERESLDDRWRDREGRPLRLLGTTLWSDFDALGTEPAKREKACRAANYYLRKTGTTRQGVPFLAEQVREESLACQQWLQGQLATPFNGTTVVVTHFAPSLRSADARYGLVPGTAGFCNAMDDQVALAQLWLHGHLHAPANYVQGGCRVVANPLGYARKNEQIGFMPRLVLEV